MFSFFQLTGTITQKTPHNELCPVCCHWSTVTSSQNIQRNMYAAIYAVSGVIVQYNPISGNRRRSHDGCCLCYVLCKLRQCLQAGLLAPLLSSFLTFPDARQKVSLLFRSHSGFCEVIFNVLIRRKIKTASRVSNDYSIKELQQRVCAGFAPDFPIRAESKGILLRCGWRKNALLQHFFGRLLLASYFRCKITHSFKYSLD